MTFQHVNDGWYVRHLGETGPDLPASLPAHGAPGAAGLRAGFLSVSQRPVSQLQSVALYEALRKNGEDVTLKLVPKRKHADDRLFTDELLAEVEAFLWASFEKTEKLGT